MAASRDGSLLPGSMFLSIQHWPASTGNLNSGHVDFALASSGSLSSSGLAHTGMRTRWKKPKVVPWTHITSGLLLGRQTLERFLATRKEALQAKEEDKATVLVSTALRRIPFYRGVFRTGIHDLHSYRGKSNLRCTVPSCPMHMGCSLLPI